MANKDEIMLTEEHRLFAEIFFGEAQAITASCEAERSSPESLIEQAEIRQLIEDMLEALTPREKEIVCLRFGIGCAYDSTQTEIAEDFGVSKGRISFLEKRAIQKLRRKFSELKSPKYLDFSIVVAMTKKVG